MLYSSSPELMYVVTGSGYLLSAQLDFHSGLRENMVYAPCRWDSVVVIISVFRRLVIRANHVLFALTPSCGWQRVVVWLCHPPVGFGLPVHYRNLCMPLAHSVRQSSAASHTDRNHYAAVICSRPLCSEPPPHPRDRYPSPVPGRPHPLLPHVRLGTSFPITCSLCSVSHDGRSWDKSVHLNLPKA